MLNIFLKLLYTILSIIAVFFVIALLFDLLNYITFLKKYKKQGLSLNYFPILGLGYYFKPKKNSKDQVSGFNELFLKHKEKIQLFNVPLSLSPQVYLTDLDLVKKFFAIENDVSKRHNTDPNFILNHCFLFKNDSRAVHLRNLTLEILKSDNMESLAPIFRELILKTIQEIKKKTSKGEFTTLVLDEYIYDLFSKIVCTFLFGEINEELVTVPGKTEETVTRFEKATKSLLNKFTFKYARDLELLKDAKRARALESEIKDIITRLVKKRSKNDYTLKSNNIVDLFIKNNQKAIKEGKKDEVVQVEEMISNILVLIFAGIDTSRHTTKTSLHFMSKNPKIRKIVVDEINLLKDDKDPLKYEKNEILENFMKEMLRLKSPVPAFINRIATKNFKLGEYKIYKGTVFSIPMPFFHLNSEYFSDPNEINLENHNKENSRKRDRMTFIPFGAGKRACVGRYIASLAIKTIVGIFAENFEFKEVEGYEEEWVVKSTYGIDECKVSIREV